MEYQHPDIAPSRCSHTYPRDDGWLWLYRIYSKYINPRPRLKAIVRGYLNPTPFESVGNGRIFRLLGVHWFGKIIPTGGLAIRRITHSRMAPYTLAGTSLRAARDFRYRTCVFEFLHMPFFLTLIILSAHRLLSGMPGMAAENMVVNLFLNLYPIMHHRYTRVRIDKLVRLRKSSQARHSRVKPMM